MRLTNDDRAAFVKAVMDDVPMINYTEQAKARAVAFLLPKLPAKLRAVYEDKALREFLKFDGWGRDTRVEMRHMHNILWFYPVSLTKGERMELDVIDAAYEAQMQSRESLRAKVTGMIKACTTLKQAKERLPEFEKYLPMDRDGTGTANLPAVANVVAELAKAGWPKGKSRS